MTSQLKKYIKSQLRNKVPASEVYQRCINRGWNPNVVRAMFNIVNEDRKKAKSAKKVIFSFFAAFIALSVSILIASSPTGFFVLSQQSAESNDFSATATGAIYLEAIPDIEVIEGFTHTETLYANSTQVETITFEGGDGNENWVSITGSDTGGPGDFAQGTLQVSPSNGDTGTYPSQTAIAEGVTSDDSDSSTFSVTVLDNNPPQLLQNISNYTWYEEFSNTSLNLTEHFNDSDGHSLSYGVQAVSGELSNINFDISDSTGIVNMTPIEDWYGSILVQFTATDSVESNTSNTVNLTIININDAPNVTSVSILPEEIYSESNLSCSFEIEDSDNSTLEVNLTWYVNETATWELFSSETFIHNVSETGYSIQNISSENTSIGDMWNCTVYATDGEYNDSLSANSSVSNTIPIFSMTDDSDASSRTIVNESVIVNLSWNDYDGDNVSIFICNTSSISLSGCADQQICNLTNTSSSGDMNCSILVTENDTSETSISYFATVCDDISCASVQEGDYYINHPPQVISESLSLDNSENITSCIGACGSGNSHNLYLKYNISSINKTVDVVIEDSFFVFEVAQILGNWSNNTIIQGVNDSWTSSSQASYLETLEETQVNSSSEISSTEIYSISIYDLVNSTYMTVQNSDEDTDELVSLKVSEKSTTSTNSSQLDSFVIGNVENLLESNGSISIQDPKLNVSYKHQLYDKSWEMNIAPPNINLNSYFEELDGETLSFSVSGNSNLDITIDNQGYVDIDVPANWYGTDSDIIFTAQDSSGLSVSMDPVDFTVEYVSGINIPVPSAGGGSSSTEIASLDLTVPSVTMESTDQLEVPFTIYNSGEVSFSTVKLSLDYDVEGLIAEINGETDIAGFSVDQEHNSTVTLTTTDVEHGEYAVELTAKTSNPELTESSTIYVTIQQFDFAKESVQKQIEFAEDLFTQNPKCLELLEIIERAKEQEDKGNTPLAKELIATAVTDCRELISEEKPEKQVSFTGFLSDNYIIILGVIAILVVIYVAAMLLLRR